MDCPDWATEYNCDPGTKDHKDKDEDTDDYIWTPGNENNVDKDEDKPSKPKPKPGKDDDKDTEDYIWTPNNGQDNEKNTEDRPKEGNYTDEEQKQDYDYLWPDGKPDHVQVASNFVPTENRPKDKIKGKDSIFGHLRPDDSVQVASNIVPVENNPKDKNKENPKDKGTDEEDFVWTPNSGNRDSIFGPLLEQRQNGAKSPTKQPVPKGQNQPRFVTELPATKIKEGQAGGSLQIKDTDIASIQVNDQQQPPGRVVVTTKAPITSTATRPPRRPRKKPRRKLNVLEAFRRKMQRKNRRKLPRSKKMLA